MEAFIRGIGNISPQPTFDNSAFLEDVREYNTARLQSIEPDYKNYIKPIQLRRMSRLLKMGVTAAGMCLHDAEVEQPDAIITGTGLGMMEETEKFLNGILDNGEKLLNPTAFIQSTHNTVGAHIAVMLGCNKYNLTYVHGPVSLENALLDSLMCLSERPSDKVLLGGIEEMTEAHFIITDSMGFWKKGPISNLDLLKNKTPGTIAGEGASFFLLSREESPQNYGQIRGLSTRFNPENQTIAVNHIEDFLAAHKLNIADIDLVILGLNGDPASDAIYEPVTGYFEGKSTMTWYKHLCGEHYLASSFALWLGARILKNQKIPGIIRLNETPKPGKIRNIMIYNHYKNIYHSLILVSSC
ncbi:MAG: beta-ketoacyl synthase chain length factor [Bacteroidales bacterium]|nr:beta-ketoacyl synthase chain length factor [Bacteroidales bacterium]